MTDQATFPVPLPLSATGPIPIVGSRADDGRPRRGPRSDVLRSLGQVTIAMAQLDGVIGDIAPDRVERTDWEAAVERIRTEWRAVLGALARGGATGDVVYVAVSSGAVIPYDVPRLERLAGRLRRLRTIGIAQGEVGD